MSKIVDRNSTQMYYNDRLNVIQPERRILMTDTVALKDAIRNSGMSLTYIADTLGITRYALYKKIDNITEFKASEIVTLKRILNLSDKERDDIFFDTKVE